ncbi:MerR family transcriptional regulator [Brevibacillus sp. FIR094]|uniref:helix-turn-helix domain-containing protein n=1 Tax=Brevibacillus sp. FIR094 TaxID=3134809 RepID=UPI003D1DFEFC
MYLKISDVANKLNVTIHTIRYYEKLGLLHVRYFTEQEVQLLQPILEWKELGFSLQQLKLIAKLEKNGLGGK